MNLLARSILRGRLGTPIIVAHAGAGDNVGRVRNRTFRALYLRAIGREMASQRLIIRSCADPQYHTPTRSQMAAAENSPPKRRRILTPLIPMATALFDPILPPAASRPRCTNRPNHAHPATSGPTRRRYTAVLNNFVLRQSARSPISNSLHPHQNRAKCLWIPEGALRRRANVTAD
jgi:hypothetical protein